MRTTIPCVCGYTETVHLLPGKALPEGAVLLGCSYCSEGYDEGLVHEFEFTVLPPAPPLTEPIVC